MTDDDALGGRLPLLRESHLDPRQRQVWDRLLATQVPEAAEAGFPARTADGRFIGPFNAYLRFPGPGAALLDWAGAQVQAHALSPAARQVVTLAVGAVWNAPFAIQAHVAGALAAGVPAPAVAAVLERRDYPDLPEDCRVARRLADALLVDHQVDDALYAAAVAVIGEEGAAAVAHLVGQYVAISALLITFAVPAVPAAPETTDTSSARA